MVLVILLQRSSNDGLSGLGGGSSSAGNLSAARGSSNPLSKATSILATLFICTSLSLAYLANAKNESVIGVEDEIDVKDASPVPMADEEIAPFAVKPEKPSDAVKKAVEQKTDAPSSANEVPMAE